MFVGTIPKGSTFLSSPPITTTISNRSPEIKRSSPLGTNSGFVKKFLDSLNAPSSIGLFNISRRQSLKHASREKSPRRSERAHSVATGGGSEKASSRSSDHRSGSGGSGQGGDYEGTSNSRSDTGRGPTEEKVFSFAFDLILYLLFSSLSGLVTFGISTSTGKNLMSGSVVAPCSFAHTLNCLGLSEVVVGRLSTSIC